MLEKWEGIVLRTNDYGESNKIVTMLTREKGKRAAMARGAKKTNSRLTGVTQPFTHGYFLVQGGKGLVTMQQGEALDSMRHIREDLLKTSYAAYITELTDKTTEDSEGSAPLFELVRKSLAHINDGMDPAIVTNIFEMKMLAQVGLRPELSSCAVCGETEGRFGFSIRENGLICHRCFEKDPYYLPLSPAAIRLLRLFYFFDLDRLGSIDVKESTKKELRAAISMYYDEYAGLYLKARRFLEQMERFEDVFKKNEPGD
ncbi:DNA repair protein RecO [Domibacillus enclensis]|uniref:DNA repair protein RecO n=1 Tax=Domibacillus enclensis TaxID=1017273 RepID=A0A1N6PP33_9BACI|nr:DNA repair protein RecO [Domibacillus enclensis]OXS80438.1 DNA repair protein RecO [Domibacillus enclensis]SIQ06168.1 DNA replication and repair protein RecO [Domibacillus enclensis]